MSGQYLRQMNDNLGPHSWDCPKCGELKRETEGMLFGAQEQSLRTRNTMAGINGSAVSPICRLNKTTNETVNHIATECQSIWNVSKSGVTREVIRACHNSCDSKQGSKADVGRDIQTDRMIIARRPVIVVVMKEERKVSLTDIATNWDSRIEEKELEKEQTYISGSEDRAPEKLEHEGRVRPCGRWDSWSHVEEFADTSRQQ